MRDSRHKTNVNSSGGGSSIGVDLTILWFYGVRPWPVAPSPPSSSPGTHGAEKSPRARLGVGGMRDGKSRSARLRLVPMHSLLPLSPLRALSRPGPPSLPPRSLDLSLLFSFSRSLVPSHGYAALALHLYALDASSCFSLPPSSFSIYI